MAVSLDERYKQMFEAHRHASDYRLKIVAAWGVVYSTLAAVFVWTQTNARALSWIITFLSCIFTFFLWAADVRNRPAIKRAKSVGAALEQDERNDIPDNQQFFTHLDEGLSHSRIIDFFALTMFLITASLTVYLFNTGTLPGR